uniref:Zinc finger protein 564 n=5 Tax=Hominoidea TaxID=314295 RepID=C9JLM4_HUMAN
MGRDFVVMDNCSVSFHLDFGD